MHQNRIHRATSADGTEIAGRVHGQGPPLVLVHGILEDGDLLWAEMLPFLEDRFTCYLMSTRGRGLSGEHPDLSLERRVEDVTAFVESIGEPVALMGESGGGMYALAAAAGSDAVSIVAAHEPVVFEVIPEENLALLEETIEQVSAAAADGRPADAARAFCEPLINEDELAAVSDTDYFEASGRYVPILLGEIQQDTQDHDYSPTDPAVLQQISVPVLLMHGSRSAQRPWFVEGVRHIAEHVGDATVSEIDGTGHWAPVLEPQPLADEFIRFYEAELGAARVWSQVGP